MSPFEIIGIIIAAIVIIVLIILHLGIRIIATTEKIGPKLTFDVKILVLSKIKVYSISYPSLEEKIDEEIDEDEEDFDFKKFLKLVEPALDTIIKFLENTIKCFEVKKLKTHLDFGLDSYCDTAKYVGYMWAIIVIPNSMFENADISVQPCFNKPILDFNGDLDIKFKVLHIILPAIKLIQDKNIREVIKFLRSGK